MSSKKTSSFFIGAYSLIDPGFDSIERLTFSDDDGLGKDARKLALDNRKVSRSFAKAANKAGHATSVRNAS